MSIMCSDNYYQIDISDAYKKEIKKEVAQKHRTAKYRELRKLLTDMNARRKFDDRRKADEMLEVVEIHWPGVFEVIEYCDICF